MAVTVATFIEALHQLPLLDAAQRQQLVGLQTQFPDLKALAQELIRRGWLTPFQVNRFAQGKASELVLGPYVLLDLLGQGGMGAVYKARQTRMDRLVALKVIRPEALVQVRAVERFQREVRAAAKLSHPNVVTVYDSNEVNGTHFLVMELIAGTDLAHMVGEQGPLPVPLACEYIRQAALGLQHAHEHGLVHRDIKPHNLMLTATGLVKVMDFGLARTTHAAAESAADGGLTGSGVLMGTADYLAPEQAQDAKHVDIRADIYSLGCTLYHLLAGEPPFAGGTLANKITAHLFTEPKAIAEVRPDVPTELGAVLPRMMAKKPEERFQTPAEVAVALGPFILPQTGVSPATRRTPIAVLGSQGTHGTQQATQQAQAAAEATLDAEPVPHRQAAQRRRSVALVLASLVLLGTVIGVYFAWRGGPGNRLGQQRPTDGSADDMRITASVRRFTGHEGKITALAFAPDGNRFLSASTDKTLRLWYVETSKEVYRFKGSAQVRALAWSRDGKQAAFVCNDARLFRWNTGTPKPWEDGSSRPISDSLAYGADDRVVGLGVSDGSFHWMHSSGNSISSSSGSNWDGGPVGAVTFCPDNGPVIVGGQDGVLHFVRGKKGKPDEHMRSLGHTGPVHALACTADGRLVLSGSDDKTARLWEAANGKPVRSFVGHDGPVTCVALSPDGRQIVTGSADKTLRQWDAATGRELRRFTEHTESVTSVAVSPDGRHALSGSADQSIRLWDLAEKLDAPDR